MPMSARVTAVLGAIGVAAVASWFRNRRKTSASVDIDASPQLDRPVAALEIDDDTAADIIRRARPELERARAEYAL